MIIDDRSFMILSITCGQGASANNSTKRLRAKHQYSGPRLHSENSSPSYIVNYNIFPISLNNRALNLVTPPLSKRWAHELSSDWNPGADDSRTSMANSHPRISPAYDAGGSVFTRVHLYSTVMWRKVAPSLHIHLAPRRTSLYSY
jgi:peptidoglycan/xylan/chitin deacetylase (PgdA/CDA1 family)